MENDQAIEQSVEDRMMGFLNAEDGEQEEKAHEPEQEEVEEVTEGEVSEEDAEPPVKLTLTHNGVEVEVEGDALKTLAQEGYDYTQKTQKLAEEKRQLESTVQAVKAQEQSFKMLIDTQQALTKEIAKVAALDEQIAQYDGVNWNAISDADPIQAQKLYIQFQQLGNLKTKAINELQQQKAKFDQQRELTNSVRLEQAKAEILKSIPAWNAELGKSLRETAKTYGATEQEVGTIMDAWVIKALHDAAQFRKLQADKGNVTKKVTGKPPVVKPGARDTKVAASAADAQARQQLKKSGRADIAAKLIERML